MRQTAAWQLEAGTATATLRVSRAIVMDDIEISEREIRQLKRSVWIGDLADKNNSAEEIAKTLNIGVRTVYQAIKDAPRSRRALKALQERHAS